MGTVSFVLSYHLSSVQAHSSWYIPPSAHACVTRLLSDWWLGSSQAAFLLGAKAGCTRAARSWEISKSCPSGHFEDCLAFSPKHQTRLTAWHTLTKTEKHHPRMSVSRTLSGWITDFQMSVWKSLLVTLWVAISLTWKYNRSAIRQLTELWTPHRRKSPAVNGGNWASLTHHSTIQGNGIC